MSLELFRRVKLLEGKVDELERKLAQAAVVVHPAPPVPVIEVKQRKKIEKVCPHCNSAPAYFFHVKNCQKRTKINGPTGSSGTT